MKYTIQEIVRILTHEHEFDVKYFKSLACSNKINQIKSAFFNYFTNLSPFNLQFLVCLYHSFFSYCIFNKFDIMEKALLRLRLENNIMAIRSVLYGMGMLTVCKHFFFFFFMQIESLYPNIEGIINCIHLTTLISYMF